jgi:two-component system chemotaxis response regulator CheY
MKLLVADDAPFIREIVVNILERAGIEVVGQAADGEEAIQLALKTRPDVILMDIVMPLKSGIDATREILKLLPQTKVIAFSTADQESMILHALEAGCCSFLNKPFKAEELLKILQQTTQATTLKKGV